MLTSLSLNLTSIRGMGRSMISATIDMMKQAFSEYGVPKTVISDRGSQFSSKEFKAFTNQYCFDHRPTEQWHIRAYGIDSEAVLGKMHFSST